MEDNRREKGLMNKYFIQKIKGIKCVGKDFFEQPIHEYELEDVPKEAEYFVLRLDGNQKDAIHRNACLKAIQVYANEIKEHIPQLSKDLIEKYGLLEFNQSQQDQLKLKNIALQNRINFLESQQDK